ncbi:hypothetical protein HID58_002666 [Brassica napus]|uniref:Vesicle-fusing ATPase n=1 Tax=Brassica napus TaxID=3708 RepID=A0ABQ8EN65_BRANA|nr:hypothetical protein HID58_002666 [Brassica napus]
MLLFGPPGTGKTLMARQIGKMLNGKDPKIVNGPEVLSKFVGDASDVHVIIFDEIDAICKSRGSTRDGTGVHDSIVNQLLTKIDGVEALNNVLLIGMTKRKDLLDEALLRPGRLEVQVEISLPDEAGRFQILQIHTNKMKENSFLGHDINLQELAARTKNYSGAGLEGAVKSATSYALNRQLSMYDLTKPVEEENIKITMEDFLHAIHEVQPAFGASTDDLECCRTLLLWSMHLSFFDCIATIDNVVWDSRCNEETFHFLRKSFRCRIFAEYFRLLLKQCLFSLKLPNCKSMPLDTRQRDLPPQPCFEDNAARTVPLPELGRPYAAELQARCLQPSPLQSLLWSHHDKESCGKRFSMSDMRVFSERTYDIRSVRKPDSWKLNEIFATGIVLGGYQAVMSVIFFWVIHKTDFCSDKFGVRSIRDNNDELMFAVYLQVSIISQALIFVTRSRSWSFVERPGALLMIAFVIAQLIATLIAVYANWTFAKVKGIGWGWAAVIWVYCILTYIPQDILKFAIRYILSGKAWVSMFDKRRSDDQERLRCLRKTSLVGERTKDAARLREIHTFKGHVESVAKLKGLDIDTSRHHYTL